MMLPTRATPNMMATMIPAVEIELSEPDEEVCDGEGCN